MQTCPGRTVLTLELWNNTAVTHSLVSLQFGVAESSVNIGDMSTFYRAFSHISRKTGNAGAMAGASVGFTSLLFRPRTFCSENTAQQPTKPVVYQYLICPFCNRVKSYLDYIDVKYDTVEVNPLTKAEINFPVENKKVPIAFFNGVKVEDSAKIIERITEMGNNGEFEHGFPSKSFFPEDTTHWTEWSEKKLAVMLYPNITRTFEESWECFEYAGKVETWSGFQQTLVRVVGTAAMSLANGKIKKKYNIVDERKELKDTVAVWCDALKGQKFLHGEQPTMPDIMVFGVLKSIEGLRTFNEVMDESPVLKEWYENVKSAMPHPEQQ